LKLIHIFIIGSQSHDEILYCADTPIDSCGYFEGEDPCDCSVVTYGESDHDEESEDEQVDDNFGGKLIFFSLIEKKRKRNLFSLFNLIS
jgi:hypothetical protein